MPHSRPPPEAQPNRTPPALIGRSQPDLAQSGLGQSRLHRATCSTNWATRGPALAGIDQSWAVLGQIWYDGGHGWSDVGPRLGPQFSMSTGQLRPAMFAKLGPISTYIGQLRPELHQVWADVGQLGTDWAKSAQAGWDRPTLGGRWSRSGRCWQHLRRSRPSLGQIGQSWLESTKRGSMLGNLGPTSTLNWGPHGQSWPASAKFGSMLANLGLHRLNVGWDGLNLGRCWPNSGRCCPHVGRNRPTLDQLDQLWRESAEFGPMLSGRSKVDLGSCPCRFEADFGIGRSWPNACRIAVGLICRENTET